MAKNLVMLVQKLGSTGLFSVCQVHNRTGQETCHITMYVALQHGRRQQQRNKNVIIKIML